jgi:uncharacterized protein (DUF1697 family)
VLASRGESRQATQTADASPSRRAGGGGYDQLIAANPFSAFVHQRPHLIRVIFLDAAPAPERAERLAAVEAVQDTCRVIGNHVYVDYIRGYHNTRRTAPYFTGILGVEGTERNWRSVVALADLLRQTPRTASTRNA